jgi:hypothetical protein
MGTAKIVCIGCIGLLIAAIGLHPSFAETKKIPKQSFSAFVQSIPQDRKFIVVNEARIFLGGDTKIVNGKGRPITVYDLKPNMYITLEVVRKPEGFFATKISIARPKGQARKP